MKGLGKWATTRRQRNKPLRLPSVAPGNIRAKDLPEERRAWVNKAPRQFPRADNPASWVKDEATWEKAKEAVRPKWDDYDEPWAVVAHVYANMGGT